MNINDMSEQDRSDFFTGVYCLPSGTYGELKLTNMIGLERNVIFARGDDRISIGNISLTNGVVHGDFNYPNGLWIDDLLLLIKNKKLEKEALKNKDVELLSTYKGIKVII